MVPNKRKRILEDFDPNKSDSEDENFDPTEDRPRKSSRRSRASSSHRSARKTVRGYQGSDIDEDNEAISDEGDSFGDESQEDDEDEDEDAPVNAAGRRQRKVATNRVSYKESSGDEDDEISGPAEETEERPRKVVKLKVPGGRPQPTRRSTRAHSEDDEGFVELSNSGRHAVVSRDSHSRSPEALTRTRRSSRSMKGLKKPPEPIAEATQESSGGPAVVDDPDAPDELSQDLETMEKTEVEKGDDDEMPDAAKAEAVEAPAQAIADDDEDDVPVTRRTRGSRASVSAPADDASDSGANRTSRGLTQRGAKKSTQEPSSDFDPGEDSEDAAMSPSEKGAVGNEYDSPTPRGRSDRRRGAASRPSRRRADSADEEPDFDLDELNEEARELRQSSRQRRRPARAASPSIMYHDNTRRSRARVNYYMPPLTSVNIEDEEQEDAAPTPARARRGRGGASQLWERHLNTTYGPFGGGGGAGSLLNGPWGTGATGGVDSDSSDDEMVHRSSIVGNVGMTPTSVAPGGLLPGAAGLNAEGVGATPNVGKIKDKKALADADPLGVDLTVDFSKVGGLQGHIDQLKEMVQLPLLYPELFSKFHVTPPRGVLFHGPPGTGKTLLARALANSIGSGGRKISFYMRKGADALSKWVGEAEKQLRLLFEEARRTQPSIIFFDEIDGLAPVRSSKQEQIHASIVSTLLALMDGMDGRGQVIVIGATNRPDNIDPALRRPGRFDREFYFPLPDLDARRSILNIHTADWGIADQFKTSLAERTKGYGGADLRALCTEAALNAIQRTYPQIYSSQEKLVVNADKITVRAPDFMISIKKLIPSSERSATSGARPLPTSIEPLLRDQLNEAKRALDEVLPRKKAITALEEAMYEQFDDADHGFGREAMQQEFERSRIFRPRFLVYGVHGMGQGYISAAVLHHLEGVHVQNFDLPSLLGDGRVSTPKKLLVLGQHANVIQPMEQVIVGLFTEVRRHQPSVIYIPNIDAWYATLSGTVALITFQTMLKSIAPTDPVLLLATAECEKGELANELFRDFFGFSRKNRMEIPRPDRVRTFSPALEAQLANPFQGNRMEYFATTLAHVKKKPAEFPDPENRKKRVLEELPVAPKAESKPPTKAEMKALKKRDHQLLNGLKIQLQPIMDQINRKYRKFRQPVIPQAQIEYLFAESEPNYVRPDVAEGQVRPFEIVKDKYGNDVLRDTATEKTYFNLETTTIEERLSNGFYARPKDFLFDIKSLARDAKNIDDKERTLKANELLSNVEVDVASIENSTSHIDWEALYQRQVHRAKDTAEKERKRKAMQSIIDRVQSDLGAGNDSDSQGPVTLGEAVPGSRTAARFQVRSPLSNGQEGSGHDSHPLSNGSGPGPSKDTDVAMGGVDEDTQQTSDTSAMGPPPKSQEASQAAKTQISQKSAVTSLPPGVSPSAVINEASTTKTSDPSTHHSSNWSTQMTNGNHGERRSDQDNDADIPDTLQVASQVTSSDDPWPHSQAQALARGTMGAGSPTSPQSRDQPSSGGSKSHGMGLGDILNDARGEEPHSVRNSGSSASQPLSVEGAIENFLVEVTDGTSGCTIEQLEQINRELMDEIWRDRHEWNRTKVLGHLTMVFNDTIGDIEGIQGMGPLSQRQNLEV